ncbi:peptidoglycan-binding domain-containing protein [Enterobacterales bacterium AE_CKDN230030158-1A_HGKHYDSX7]
MSLTGQDVIDVGSSRIGQKYVLGANVPLDNPNWKGPWDCAEFMSWCAYQAYGLVFGAGNPSSISKAEPYSGYWFSEAKTKGILIAWEEALNIPGAALIRAPTAGKIGHAAFAIGDNEHTLEARGAAYGVGVFGGALKRPWSIGCLLPGVEYAGHAAALAVVMPKAGVLEFPDGYLWLKKPRFKGPAIVALQQALKARGVDPGPIDGEFGPMTHAAVSSLQLLKKLEVDGVVGPNTAKALGLDFPIVGTASQAHAFEIVQSPPAPASLVLAPASVAAGIDLVADIAQSGKSFVATTGGGFTFIVGTTTTYHDDMQRVGLYQGTSAINDSRKFGVYDADDFTGAFGAWAHFIGPTLKAEGGGRFATLNTYDRAAFTFGAPQLAAHTPGSNFILYLRELLQLADASSHFPELSLRKNAAGQVTVHLAGEGGFVDLERATTVVRPNGKKESQLVELMKYLNPSATQVDAAELTAAARLLNWLRDPKARELQIKVFVNAAKGRLAVAKANVVGFTGSDWRTALWIMDILHQGRGSYLEMTQALKGGSPEDGLMKIGWPKYKGRIQEVRKAVDDLAASGVLNGFKV